MSGPLTTRGFALLFWLTAAVIYLPILVMAVFSFSAARYQILPIPAYTTEWYVRIFADGQYSAGFFNSIVLAGSVSLIATLIGFACAYSLVNARFPGKTAVTLLILAPLAVPLLLVGIALRIWTTMLGLQPSLPLAGVGQVLYVLPLAVLNLRNRIAQLPKSHEEAAWALGASRLSGHRRRGHPGLPALSGGHVPSVLHLRLRRIRHRLFPDELFDHPADQDLDHPRHRL
jgi:ABC-type spermidine/putrescine transport system permease subunit II